MIGPRPVRILAGPAARYPFAALCAAPAPKAEPVPVEETTPQTKEDTRLTSEILDNLRAKLKASKHPERRSIIRDILAGKPFAPKGERDRALQRVASWMSWIEPEAAPEVVAELLIPSLEAMEAVSPDDYLTFDDAVRKIERAQADARIAREEKRQKNERFLAALNRNAAPQNDNGATGDVHRVETVPAPTEGVPVAQPDSPTTQPSDRHVFTQEDLVEAAAHLALFGDQTLAQLRRLVIVQPSDEKPWVLTTRGHEAFNRQDVPTVLKQTVFPPEFYQFQVFREGRLCRKTDLELRADLTTHVSTVVHDATVRRAVMRTDPNDPDVRVWHVPAAVPRQLEPAYDAEADRYIELFAGNSEAAERFKDWLALYGDLQEPLPAIIALGPKDVGKSFLARALGALWVVGGGCTPADAYWQGFNSEVEHLPLLLADERGPEEGFSHRPVSSEKIRALLTEFLHTLNTKYGARFIYRGAVRLVCAVNDLESAHLVDDDLSQTSLDAVAERFLLLQPGPECAKYLASVNSFAKEWLTGREVLPRLFAWYRLTRKPNIRPAGAGKFRVPGNAVDLLGKLEVRSQRAQLVVEAIFRFLREPRLRNLTPKQPPILVRGGKVYIRLTGFVEHWALLTGITEKDARRTTPTACTLGKELAGIIDQKVCRPLKKVGETGPCYSSVKIQTLRDYAPKCDSTSEEVLSQIGKLSAEAGGA